MARMSLRQDLPYLNALAVFEVAARTSNFTAAARELGIAQSAVSRHVANLERYFGLDLFVRSGTRLAVTAEGRSLADAVGTGLGHVRSVLNDLRRARASAVITIACSYDVAYLWLMPRFGALRAEAPDSEIRLITATDYSVFEDASIDLSIRFGHVTDWPDTIAVKLFDEEVFPVCSPAFLAAHPELKDGDPRRLAALPLLHLDHKDTLRGVRWRQWFARAGLPVPPAKAARSFPNYAGSLFEAISGGGIALGWTHLLGDFMERGLLVRASPLAVETDWGRFAVHRAGLDSVVDRIARYLARSAGRPVGLGPAMAPPVEP
jgi:LysR family glycine cleavage system transcriptional activator